MINTIPTPQTSQTPEIEIKFPLEIEEMRERGIIAGLSGKPEGELPGDINFHNHYLKLNADIDTHYNQHIYETLASKIQSAKNSLDEFRKDHKDCKERANKLRTLGISRTITDHLIWAGYLALSAVVWLITFMLKPILFAGKDPFTDLIREILKFLGNMNKPPVIPILILFLFLSLLLEGVKLPTNEFLRLLREKSGRLQGASLILLVLGGFVYYLRNQSGNQIDPISQYTIVGIGFATVTVSVMIVYIYALGYNNNNANGTRVLSQAGFFKVLIRAMAKCNYFPDDKWGKWLIIIAVMNILLLGIFAVILSSSNNAENFKYLAIVPLILYLALSSLCLVIGYAQKDIFLDELRAENNIKVQENEIARLEDEHKSARVKHMNKLSELDRKYQQINAAFVEGFELANHLKRKLNSLPGRTNLSNEEFVNI